MLSGNTENHLGCARVTLRDPFSSCGAEPVNSRIRIHSRWLILLLIILFSTSNAASASDPERASIKIPPLESGYSSVSIISLRRSWSLRSRYLFNRSTVSLKSGTYHAKLVCNRSRVDVLLAPHDHSHALTFVVRDGESYVLDCSITDGGGVEFVFDASSISFIGLGKRNATPA